MYDTVAQYGQVIGGKVDDWHPPIMVRLWQLLAPLGRGTAPMFVLQVVLYAAGFALIVAALANADRPRAALATAVFAVSPLLLGWQMVVLKDAQMLGALITATGIVAHFRLAERRVPWAAVAAAALLIAYATLVRANAVFATVPLAIGLFHGRRGGVITVVTGVLAVFAVLVVSPFINHRLLGASPSGVQKSLPLFDLAAIAVAAPNGAVPFTADQAAQLRQRHCVKAFFWDPITDAAACGPITGAVDALPADLLYRDWLNAIVSHPLTYAGHRLAHWNSTERWLVPPGLMSAGPPADNEPNELGLSSPGGRFAPGWQKAAAAEAGTPIGWPIVWTLVAAMLFPAAWRERRERAGGLALALIVSALILEGSFLAISIASDLRYHLWTMAAAALALILLAPKVRRREWLAGAAVLALVIGGGLWTRSAWARAPSDYETMVQWSEE